MSWEAIQRKFEERVEEVPAGALEPVGVLELVKGEGNEARDTQPTEQTRQTVRMVAERSRSRAVPEGAKISWRDFPRVVALSGYLRQVRDVVEIQLYRLEGGGFGLRPIPGIEAPGASEEAARRFEAWTRAGELYHAARPDLDILVAAGAMTLSAKPPGPPWS